MRTLWSIAIGLNSFTSMAYALALTAIVIEQTSEDILAQCLTMGPYVLGLGLGSALAEKLQDQDKLLWPWRLEALALLAGHVLPLLFLVAAVVCSLSIPPLLAPDDAWYLSRILLTAALLALAIGVLGGAQFPLLLRFFDLGGAHLPVAANYLGPLFALALLFGFEQRARAPADVFFAISALHWGAVLILAFVRGKRGALFLSIFLILPAPLCWQLHRHLELLVARVHYLGARIPWHDWRAALALESTLSAGGHLERRRSGIQVIDVWHEPVVPEIGAQANRTLLLNRRPQFDDFTSETYHSSMVAAAQNLLARPPREVLVLGAGDGVLLARLRRHIDFQRLTLVELDPGMVEFSRRHPWLRELNEQAWDAADPRTELRHQDALFFLKHNRRKFDLVLIDLPFPHTHELARLYSMEFYQLLRRALAPEAVAILDLPLLYGSDGRLAQESAVILSTLRRAGVTAPLLFGPSASFLAFAGDGRALRFDYAQLARWPLSVLINLATLPATYQQTERIHQLSRPGGL